MSAPRGDVSDRPPLPAIALEVARSALPTIAALAVIVAADALLDGWAVVLVAVATLAVLVVVVRKLDRKDQQLAGVSDGMRDAAGAAPLIIAVVAYVLADMDALVLAVGYVATWIFAQTLLVWSSYRSTRTPSG